MLPGKRALNSRPFPRGCYSRRRDAIPSRGHKGQSPPRSFHSSLLSRPPPRIVHACDSWNREIAIAVHFGALRVFEFQEPLFLVGRAKAHCARLEINAFQGLDDRLTSSSRIRRLVKVSDLGLTSLVIARLVKLCSRLSLFTSVCCFERWSVGCIDGLLIGIIIWN